MSRFWGYHSEWNLGSPGGWDYQRITQVIGKAVWTRLNQLRPTGIDLDFDHPLLHPIDGFIRMLVAGHAGSGGNRAGGGYCRGGNARGCDREHQSRQTAERHRRFECADGAA